MFSKNYLGFCSLKRWHLLSASIFKRVQIYGKNVVRLIHDSLTDFSYSSNESDEK